MNIASYSIFPSNICVTCLSTNRNLSPIPCLSEWQQLFEGLAIVDLHSESWKDVRVCWECRALLYRFLRFKQKAQTARMYLQLHQSRNGIAKQKCLSNLSCTKITEPTFYCIYTEEVEIKIELKNPILDSPNCDDNAVKNVVDENNIKIELVEEIEMPLARFKFGKGTLFKEKQIEQQKPECVEVATEKITKSKERFREIVMTEKEMLESRKARRVSPQFVKRPYRCDSCILGYYNEEAYKEHIRDKHDESNGAFKCDICSVSFPSDAVLRRHRPTHLVRYECKVCPFSSRHMSDMTRHYFSKHEQEKTYPCKSCPMVFLNWRLRRNHHLRQHKEQIKCEQCGKGFAYRCSYKRHLQNHAGVPLVKCDICHKNYRGALGLKAHMRTHKTLEAPGDAYCAECDVQFTHLYVYRQHLKYSSKHVTQEQMRFPCSECDKRFPQRCLLKRHFDYAHLKSTKFICSTCNKSYYNTYDLRRHIQCVHERIPPVKNKVCHICGRKFATKTQIQNHIRTHTGERPFQCPSCPATFGHTASLYTHNKLVHLKCKRVIKRKNTKKAKVSKNLDGPDT